MSFEAMQGISAVSSLAGSAASSYSQYRAGQAQQSASEFNAAVNMADAKAVQDQAAYAEKLQRRKSSALMGAQRALYAKAGVSISEGTPLDLLAEQAANAEQDALAIRYAGEVKSTHFINQANANLWQGDQAAEAGKIGAIGTMMSGVGRTANAYATSKTLYGRGRDIYGGRTSYMDQ